MKKFIKKNKKELKDEGLKEILKQFKDFQFLDKKKKDNRENIKGRLLAYIPYANRVTQQYENLKNKYLRLNISFIAVIAFFFTFIFIYFETNLLQKLPIIIGSLLFALCCLFNIFYNLFRNPTRTLSQTTLWFYRGNVPDERNPCISNEHITNFLNKLHRTEEEFIKEDLKTLFNLYLYQANYYNLALKTRRTFFVSFSLYLVSFIIQICVFL